MVQALFLCFPKLLWNIYENEIVNWLNKNISKVKEGDEVIESIDVKQLFKSKMARNSVYNSLLFVEVLNLINTIAQFILITYLLGVIYPDTIFEFTESFNFNNGHFPQTINCQLLYFDSSFNLESKNHLCYLLFNKDNKQIFWFLAYWFLILIALNLGNLFFRLFDFSPSNRARRLANQTNSDERVIREVVINETTISGYFILKTFTRGDSFFELFG